jgi:glycosyltransferase involved in cell wall biosynthesis
VPSDRIRLIPNGWAGAPSLSRDAAREDLGLRPGDVVVGWVGRLSPEKGADILIAAASALPRDVVISFLGDGRERASLEAQAAALSVSDRVRWHGAVRDAGRLMAAFDVYVLSSRTEGTPIALFEAMSARVPAVVTAVGGVPDVVTDREAVLVPSEDPTALAAAIVSVLDGREASRLRADAAAHRLQQVYSADAWLDRYDELYHSVQPRR